MSPRLKRPPHINVLKKPKKAIAFETFYIRGIDPEFCSHKILLEDDYEPSVQHQGRVNPKIHDVIKKEVEKLIDAGLIYPILDSPWVSPVHCVPKKGGAKLSASVTLNSLGNEDKVFKPGILVYQAIHDNNLVPLEENLKENISSGTLLVFKEPSFLLPPPEPSDIKKCFEPEAGILIIKEFKVVSKSHDFMTGILPTLPTLVSDLTFISSFVSFENEDTIFDPDISI
ncbi:hypothetical protein Tco_1121059 [Tanacetum coccineum]|uniref:Reverse transcriptase domain-containing protein n=1 Tax=Tanacetum coccineum TaxID=301880 RepID=A0ABQ5IWM6_9ASTR